jgi:CheY-like chemotaxis protein
MRLAQATVESAVRNPLGPAPPRPTDAPRQSPAVMTRKADINTKTKVPDIQVHPTETQETSRTPGLLRVLLIEDNASDALLAESYLRGVIPDVEVDAVTRLSDVTPDSVTAASCALLDLSLPDASGLAALHALRAMSAELPIIVLTGFDDLEVGLSAIGQGAEDYLVKNYVDGDSLQRAIRYAVERRRLDSALAKQVAPRTSMRTAAGSGTHQVSIELNNGTSIFSLRCETCAWAEDSDLEGTSTWGQLERALLPHVVFGKPHPSPAVLGFPELAPSTYADVQPVDTEPVLAPPLTEHEPVTPSRDDTQPQTIAAKLSAACTWLG